jgi:hypothetical protein
MDFLKVADIASKLSLVTLLVLILIGGHLGFWVYGSTYKDMTKDRDEWKTLALKGANVAALASNQTIAGMRASTSLPRISPSASKSQVADLLHHVENRAKFVTEPSDPRE